MARPTSPHPTELELRILKVLWREGPRTIRQVRDALADGGRDLAFNSVMTTMNTMVAKRYLRRRQDSDAYVYTARVSEDATAARMLRDLVNRVFDGSVSAAVLRLLKTSDIDKAELARLRELIDRKQSDAGSKP